MQHFITKKFIIMATPTPIVTQEQPKKLATSNLFRFINYADPKLKLPTQNVAYAFLENLNPTESIFLSAIDGLETQEEINAAVATVLETFTPITSITDIIAINQLLYVFGEFTAKYSFDTTTENVWAKIAGATNLSEAEKNTLWDNLYYQAIKTGSTLAADAVVQLLRADAFLTEFTLQNGPASPPERSEDAEYLNKTILQRISTANIVVPIELVNREYVAPQQPKGDLDITSKQLLLRKNTADKTLFEVNELQRVIDEFINAEIKYNQENTDDFLTQYKNYVETINEHEPSEDENQNPEPFPIFEFTPQNPFREEFLNENLSDEAKIYFQNLKHRVHSNWQDIVVATQNKINSEYNKIRKNSVNTDLKILLGDIEIPITNHPQNNTFVATAELKTGTENLYQVFITQYFDNPETAITRISITARDAEENEFESSATTPLFQADHYVTFLLFPEGVELNENGYDLEGEYEIENTAFSSSFVLPAFKYSKPFYGDAQFAQTIMALAADADLEPGNDDVKLYGVKRIGVMEYKRVEQRVCCYVAGEVSHIENIMAREYKEKETRNLNRFETIQEDTTERESEKMTDTTTTERHEINTEISQVIQEEQSRQIGINAGVSGFYHSGDVWGVDVFANTNMNFTNSSAKTGSVSTSEALAKEYVERATQRLVEKISSKRIKNVARV